MTAAIALFADRIPGLAEPGYPEFAAAFSGMVSAAKLAGATEITAWALCPSKEESARCRESAQAEAEKLGANLLFAVCPAFFANPTDRCANAAGPLAALFTFERPELLLFEDGIRSRELALPLGVESGAICMTEVRGFERGAALALRRSAYNANLTAQMNVPLPTAERPGVFTVVPGDFPPAGAADPMFTPKVQDVSLPWEPKPDESSRAAQFSVAKTEGGLKSAKRVVVCGHGMGTAEKAKSASKLAEAFSASFAGTRPTVIDGWIDHSQLIGISGMFVKPEVCITLGASGARAFAAGVRESGLLIAVNTDETAPIFRMCDVGVVCDGAEFAEALAAHIQENR